MQFPGKDLNIAVVDDHPTARRGIAAIVNAWPHGKVVLQAENGMQYEQLCATAPPIHIVIVDLNMPLRNGFDTIAWIRQHQPLARPIALGYDAAPGNVLRALHCGARAVLSKMASDAEFHAALDDVRLHNAHFNELVRPHIDEHGRLRPEPDRTLRELVGQVTPRQLQVLHAIFAADHPTYAVAAKRIKMKLSTLKTHVANLTARFHAVNRQGLHRMYLQAGLDKQAR
jgi:two-component system invasion response regulator UvrY